MKLFQNFFRMKPAALWLFTILIATGFFDLYLVFVKGVDGSISEAVVSMTNVKAQWVYYVLGNISGHLFFPMIAKGIKVFGIQDPTNPPIWRFGQNRCSGDTHQAEVINIQEIKDV